MGNTEQFNRMASQYDSPERKRIAKIIAKAIREKLQEPEKKDAMDFGCGTGLVGLEFIEDFHSLTFVDSSENMIQEVKKKLSTVENNHVQTLCFDLEVADFPEEQVDVIFLSQVLLHVKNTKMILEKLWKTLRGNGQLILVDFDKNQRIQSTLVHNGFDQQDLTNTLLDTGFRSVDSQTFYEGKNLFMGQPASLFVLNAKK
jgi:ubiquinone/menaquinone biosynthesis C-methylase UbiE